MIKRIELINFMSHAHTVIEPAEGLTVLVGPNNCGKSAVMSALQILAHNESSTYVTRHGEKETSVIIETTEGDVIEWTRKKTTSKYIVNGETFDRLNKKVPPQVAELIRLPKVHLEQGNEKFDIHFGDQKQPVFLLNESGRAAAGFFAASSDASRLIEMQKLHKQKVTESGRDLIRLQNDKKELEIQARQLESIPNIQKQFDSCNEILHSIEFHQSAIQAIKKTTQRVVSVQHQKSQLNARDTILAKISHPPTVHPTSALEDLTSEIDSIQQQQRALSRRAKLLDKIPKPVRLHETQALAGLLATISHTSTQQKFAGSRSKLLSTLTAPPAPNDTTALESIIHQINSAVAEKQKWQAKLKIQNAQFEQLQSELESFAEANPTCPTCGQDVTSQSLLKSFQCDERHR